ncbi:hypothetical protein [Nocardioides marmotae]|uniref:hypothetical protein n=1 Tax=Nocardioides marmotae TaxID=2663857 RepID=UPI0012B52047|nr:hypothetical protein [Nocardioides marmotae]MBC9733908.1 hypothetical protein [Nocardioides marmotae]MTB85011.1 hypothetical protein [Nocardioides marmotae]
MSYFLSPYAYLVAAVAVVLGLVARTEASSRRLGNAAVAVGCAAVLAASATLLVV